MLHSVTRSRDGSANRWRRDARRESECFRLGPPCPAARATGPTAPEPRGSRKRRQRSTWGDGVPLLTAVGHQRTGRKACGAHLKATRLESTEMSAVLHCSHCGFEGVTLASVGDMAKCPRCSSWVTADSVTQDEEPLPDRLFRRPPLVSRWRIAFAIVLGFAPMCAFFLGYLRYPRLHRYARHPLRLRRSSFWSRASCCS